ncbi:MAG: hypothetical protein IAI50_10265, partial [Candidatus Eremiobacteraeota bacterium]|nr:hypothetical protein [Candidatus Eremiobacteraeota bacterium]
MGRFTSGVAALALAVAVWTPAPAQSLATLHVRRFSIAADRTTVRAGEPFHVTMTARVDEPVTDLDNVTLPDLAEMDVSGDERRCTATPTGSDCSETLTVAATVPGDRTIGPWTMDVIDGKNHRPSRFSSNTIVIHVTGPSALENIGTTLRALALAAISAFVGIGVAALAVWIVLRIVARRRRPAAVEVIEPEPAQPPPPVARASFGELVEALAREPTRARAVAVREALRDSVGAREDETYADLVARR